MRTLGDRQYRTPVEAKKTESEEPAPQELDSAPTPSSETFDESIVIS